MLGHNPENPSTTDDRCNENPLPAERQRLVPPALRECAAANRQVILLGTAFSFVHLLDQLAETKLHLSLPPGSRVLETGGYKGRSRTLPKAELHALITRFLGIPSADITCEYGMSELSSQAYDRVAGDRADSQRVFQFPPWTRVKIISPETGRSSRAKIRYGRYAGWRLM